MALKGSKSEWMTAQSTTYTITTVYGWEDIKGVSMIATRGSLSVDVVDPDGNSLFNTVCNLCKDGALILTVNLQNIFLNHCLSSTSVCNIYRFPVA